MSLLELYSSCTDLIILSRGVFVPDKFSNFLRGVKAIAVLKASNRVL